MAVVEKMNIAKITDAGYHYTFLSVVMEVVVVVVVVLAATGIESK